MHIKRLFIIILLLAVMPDLQARPFLRSCDLLFVGASKAREPESMDSAISAATSDSVDGGFTHVAVVERRGLSLWVIDATPQHGVARRRLRAFLREQDPDAEIVVKRLKDFRDISRHRVIRRAKSFLWQSYDFTYMPDNDMVYCSELVRDSFLTRDGRHVFNAAPMNFLAPDGTLPEFWHELFESLETEVPQGVPGTNPQDMSCSDCLRMVGSL